VGVNQALDTFSYCLILLRQEAFDRRDLPDLFRMTTFSFLVTSKFIIIIIPGLGLAVGPV
jgi:hypothetical protein